MTNTNNTKLNALLVVLEYRTDFESLIFNLSSPPGSNLPTYNQDFLTAVLECYYNKFSIKTVRRLILENEKTWAAKGYKIQWDNEYAYNLIADVI